MSVHQARIAQGYRSDDTKDDTCVHNVKLHTRADISDGAVGVADTPLRAEGSGPV